MLIYIMGDARSGSTPLGIVLGSHPEIECVGELFRWPQFRGGPKPGDGKEGHHRFWEAVRNVYDETAGPPDFARLISAQEEFEDYIKFPRVILGRYGRKAADTYCRHERKLVHSIRSVSESEVLVDTSKRMGRAWMLAHCLDEPVRIIHLVRDPRGTLWSFMKREVEQKPKSPLKTLVDYSAKNAMSSLVRLGLPEGSVLRVRYEDLFQSPRTELKRIGEWMGLEFSQTVLALEGHQQIPVPFLLDGNRIRTKSTIQMGLDDEWRRRLPPAYRALALGMTAPFSLAYGYFSGG